jgi:hypothetical protein
MRKYFIAILLFAILSGCEKDFDEIIDVNYDNYQVISVTGIKDSVDLKNPPDSLLNLKVSFTPESQVNKVFFNIYASDNTVINSSPVEMLNTGNNNFEKQYILRSNNPIGNYSIKFSATGSTGISKQVAVGNFYFNNGQDNVAPLLSDLDMIDTVAKGVSFIFTVTASDSNGLNDIQFVYFELYRPDSSIVQNPPNSGNTLIFMDDTGDLEHFGDQISGDGIYSFKNSFLDDPSTQTGTWRFEFQARDRSGILSNKIFHNIVVL